MLFAGVLNQDLDRLIDGFYPLTALAKIMTLSRGLNGRAMVLVGKSYGKNVPRSKVSKKRPKVLHMGMLLTEAQQQMARLHLIKSLEHSLAALSRTCMLCKKRCQTISVYGFVAHAGCARKREVEITSVPSIERDMVAHLDLPPRPSASRLIKRGIPGVYPHALSLEGFTEKNKVQIARARETAARINRLRVERHERVRIWNEENGARIKEEVQGLVGVPFSEWLTSSVPVWYTHLVLRFASGAECLSFLAKVKEFPVLRRDAEWIFPFTPGTSIDASLARERIDSCLERFHRSKNEAAGKKRKVVLIDLTED